MLVIFYFMSFILYLADFCGGDLYRINT